VHQPKILITGATGKTGSATALQLLAKGYPVRAFVHREDARIESLRSAGAEIFAGSLEDFADLRCVMRGVQRAYFCPPLEYGTLRRSALFAAAAREARLEMVVVLSQWLVDPNHLAIHSREKWLSNQVFESAPGLDVVTVAPGFFADNYMVALEPIAQLGIMSMPLGDGLNAPPSNEDIARVIVGVLVNPAPHIGRSYRPTGPDLLSPDQIAATFGKVLGTKVKYQNVGMSLFLKAAKALAIPDFVIEELYWFLQDYQRNSFGIGAPTSAVLDVGGNQPEDFEKIVRRYVSSYARAKRTPLARLRAIANLLKTATTRTPDPTSIARRLAIPKTTHATLAADSALWKATHECPGRAQ
jgi:NAD(P)H dehydrogenase (quinone)